MKIVACCATYAAFTVKRLCGAFLKLTQNLESLQNLQFWVTVAIQIQTLDLTTKP